MKIIESDFEYKGYRCITIFTDLGHRCGYVGIPEGHPLYGKNEDSEINVTIKELVDNEDEENKRSPIALLIYATKEPEDLVNLGLYFNVHGGITYAKGGKDSHHPIDSDLWWLGFDCGHYGDCPDYRMLGKIWSDNEIVRRRVADECLYGEGIVRDLDYVQQECRDLVDQIIELVDGYYK